MTILVLAAVAAPLALAALFTAVASRQIERRNGRDEAVLRTLYWRGNLQSGVILQLSPEMGIDFGYETFDDAWHLAIVANW